MSVRYLTLNYSRVISFNFISPWKFKVRPHMNCYYTELKNRGRNAITPRRVHRKIFAEKWKCIVSIGLVDVSLTKQGGVEMNWKNNYFFEKLCPTARVEQSLYCGLTINYWQDPAQAERFIWLLPISVTSFGLTSQLAVLNSMPSALELPLPLTTPL